METFEFVTKKKTRKNRLLAVGLSVVTVCGLYVGARMLSGKLIGDKAWEVVHTMELVESVAYPNISTYTWGANGGDLFTGGIKGQRMKDVYGVPVYYSDYTAHFSWFSINWDTSLDSRSGLTQEDGTRYQVYAGQKIPQFYNVHAKEVKNTLLNKPTQELPYTKEMQNQLVEVAVTFDKPYTLKEIREMIPITVKTNWYWIGTNTTGDASQWGVGDLYGTSDEGFTKEEWVNPDLVEKEMGNVDKNGAEMSEEAQETKTVDAFFTNLKTMLKLPGESSYNDVTPRDDVKAYLKKFGHLDLTKESDLEQLEFSGVILTGPAEHFAELEDKPWIYASSIGASISKLPYYHVETE